MAAQARTLKEGVELCPPLAHWFRRRFPEGPTAPQAEGWPAIASGAHTLIAAPTGSGKTLAAFLLSLDRIYRAHLAGEHQRHWQTRLLYISPLRALAVDIRENLLCPLQEIAQCARELGVEPPSLTVAVRNGDTKPQRRRALLKRPPTFLLTTPESLYLMLTSPLGRKALVGVETVVVDEIHALVGSKRGDHLGLSLERLEELQDRPFQRVGLSATQRPLSRCARLLGGRRPVKVVDCGHRRPLDLQLALPPGELAAYLSAAQLTALAEQIATSLEGVQTALVFVNTRRLAERFAHLLGNYLPADQVRAHHGSLALGRRREAEELLRAGRLKALVATSSLELGIDVGPVELVCQLGSPHLISSFLQRAGRANHSRHGVPRAVLYPLSRDDLVECAALLLAVREGRLDLTPQRPLSLELALQQLAAEVAAAGVVAEERLWALLRRSGPYRNLPRNRFQELITLLCDGVPTGSGRRAALLHRDGVYRRLRPLPATRLQALTNGGAIAEEGDFRVVVAGEGTVVGEVNEDFALESMVGDVFLLGTSSWRVVGVRRGEVMVVDAGRANPSIPFWLGEAPGRSRALALAESRLRRAVRRALERGGKEGARRIAGALCGVDEQAAAALVDYLGRAVEELGVLPTVRDVVFERFFDEAGGMQLVVHAPFGIRVNRAWALALRKRFCVTFDFELQAAANDNGFLLSLGPQHSFPLPEAVALLSAKAARPALEQAILPSPLFKVRWRHTLNRALAVARWRSGKRVPVALQRMEAEDLLAALFPALAACQENALPGPIPIPDHPLVRQTLHDCLEEVLDLAGLERVLRGVERGLIRTHFVDGVEPSVLSQELLGGRPYTFLDEAPLEERRSRNVAYLREQRTAFPLAHLAPEAVAQVRQQAAPRLLDREALHRLLLATVLYPAQGEALHLFEGLVAEGRALALEAQGRRFWLAREQLAAARSLQPSAPLFPPPAAPLPKAREELADQNLLLLLRGHLELLGPVSAEELAGRLALPVGRVRSALAALEGEGFVLRVELAGERWCARSLLGRIHALTRRQRRNAAAVRPLSRERYHAFLLRWQGVGRRFAGEAGLRAVVGRLQGYELAAGAWEEEVLAVRLAGYQPALLDRLCLAGEVAWGRLTLPAQKGEGGRRSPSRATPITLALRSDLPWLAAALRGSRRPEPPAAGPARDLYEALRAEGALFAGELGALTGRLPAEVEAGLLELVARGVASADSFGALRSLFAGARRRALGGPSGRWFLLGTASPELEEGALAERVALLLVRRWGLFCRELMARESFALPWRAVLLALRRLEEKGLVVGGRFVEGISGEQYLLPEARQLLLAAASDQQSGELLLGAADPLNLAGILWEGKRVAPLPGRPLSCRPGQPPAPLMGKGGGRRV